MPYFTHTTALVRINFRNEAIFIGGAVNIVDRVDSLVGSGG
jgi:hypothetical protein